MNYGKLFFFIALASSCARPMITNIPLLTFSPYLVYHLTHSTFKGILWRAILIGFCQDCFSSFFPFGFHTAVYPACCALLYKKRSLLIGDKPLSLPLYTFVFALIFSLSGHLISFLDPNQALTRLLFVLYRVFASTFTRWSLCIYLFYITLLVNYNN